jgi:carboxyl-terminal processing protease
VKKIVADMSEMMDIIRSNYATAQTIDTGSLSKSALEGALGSLDPHSNFFDAAEYRDLLEEQQSEYSGVGAVIAERTQNGKTSVYIMSTVPGSPAAMARLSYGDKVLKIDGEDFSERTADDTRDAIRGSSGVNVKLTVERASTGRIETLELRRRVVAQPSIKDSFVLPGNIGYIAMTEGFNYTTADELTGALRRLHQQRIKGLVIDLRENPGGILEQAVRVAEKFLPEGSVIVSQRGRAKFDNRVWKSTNRSPETLPLVLLVNENSASASEILAGALQDHDRALIVGETTFGKGLVQSLYDGPFGSGLTLTTARYYTPSGRLIQRQYSDASTYDYYNHRSSINPADKVESHTSGNRVVYGGDGIEPDTIAKSLELTETQQALSDAVFFFVRNEIVAKNAKQFEARPAAYRPSLMGSFAPVVDEKLLGSFANYYASISGRTADVLSGGREFIIERLSFELTLAAKGDASANRILIASDVPVLTALSQLPKARELALAGRMHRSQK